MVELTSQSLSISRAHAGWVYSLVSAQEQRPKQDMRTFSPFCPHLRSCSLSVLPIAAPDESSTAPLGAFLFLSAGPQWSCAHEEAAALVAALLLCLHRLAGFGVVLALGSCWAGVQESGPAGGCCRPSFEVAERGCGRCEGYRRCWGCRFPGLGRGSRRVPSRAGV